MATFEAIRIEKSGEKGTSATLGPFDEADLMDGDVTVAVSHSTINYKDGLAITGKSPVVRRFPMIGGIDFAGTVETSSHPDFKAGDQVILNGWGTGETHLGGYAKKSRVKGDWLVPLPAGLTPAQAMAIGTAGYTAMLSVLALEKYGVTPAGGPVVVTGAAGGVGSVAIALLAKLGWHVIASTGRAAEGDYLKGLGAADNNLLAYNCWAETGDAREKPCWNFSNSTQPQNATEPAKTASVEIMDSSKFRTGSVQIE